MGCPRQAAAAGTVYRSVPFRRPTGPACPGERVRVRRTPHPAASLTGPAAERPPVPVLRRAVRARRAACAGPQGAGAAARPWQVRGTATATAAPSRPWQIRRPAATAAPGSPWQVRRSATATAASGRIWQARGRGAATAASGRPWQVRRDATASAALGRTGLVRPPIALAARHR